MDLSYFEEAKKNPFASRSLANGDFRNLFYATFEIYASLYTLFSLLTSDGEHSVKSIGSDWCKKMKKKGQEINRTRNKERNVKENKQEGKKGRKKMSKKGRGRDKGCG